MKNKKDNQNMQCLVCDKVIYSDCLARSCMLCGMALDNEIKDDFCCEICERTFEDIKQGAI